MRGKSNKDLRIGLLPTLILAVIFVFSIITSAFSATSDYPIASCNSAACNIAVVTNYEALDSGTLELLHNTSIIVWSPFVGDQLQLPFNPEALFGPNGYSNVSSSNLTTLSNLYKQVSQAFMRNGGNATAAVNADAAAQKLLGFITENQRNVSTFYTITPTSIDAYSYSYDGITSGLTDVCNADVVSTRPVDVTAATGTESRWVRNNHPQTVSGAYEWASVTYYKCSVIRPTTSTAAPYDQPYSGSPAEKILIASANNADSNNATSDSVIIKNVLAAYRLAIPKSTSSGGITINAPSTVMRGEKLHVSVSVDFTDNAFKQALTDSKTGAAKSITKMVIRVDDNPNKIPQPADPPFLLKTVPIDPTSTNGIGTPEADIDTSEMADLTPNNTPVFLLADGAHTITVAFADNNNQRIPLTAQTSFTITPDFRNTVTPSGDGMMTLEAPSTATLGDTVPIRITYTPALVAAGANVVNLEIYKNGANCPGTTCTKKQWGSLSASGGSLQDYSWNTGPSGDASSAGDFHVVVKAYKFSNSGSANPTNTLIGNSIDATVTLSTTVNPTNGTGLKDTNTGDGSKDGTGEISLPERAIKSISALFDALLTRFLWVISGAAVIAIIYGGVTMVQAAGDSGKAASGKKIIIYAIVGLILAVMTQYIVTLVINIATR